MKGSVRDTFGVDKRFGASTSDGEEGQGYSNKREGMSELVNRGLNIKRRGHRRDRTLLTCPIQPRNVEYTGRVSCLSQDPDGNVYSPSQLTYMVEFIV